VRVPGGWSALHAASNVEVTHEVSEELEADQGEVGEGVGELTEVSAGGGELAEDTAGVVVGVGGEAAPEADEGPRFAEESKAGGSSVVSAWI